MTDLHASSMERARALTGQPYMIISADDHAGPRPSVEFPGSTAP